MKRYFENKLDELIEQNEKEQGNDEGHMVFDLKQYPAYLYKYRSCDKDFNFAMIGEEYLWADIPANFLDPYDSFVNLKLVSELPIIQKWLWQHLGELLYYSIPPKGMIAHKNGQTLENYIAAQKEFMDSKGRYSAKKAKSLMILETKKLHPIQRQDVKNAYERFESTEFEKEMEDAIKRDICSVVNSLRNRNLVCCLTARKDNKKMWEEYADKYTGFVIEYNLSEIKRNTEQALVLSRMFPVTYYKRMPKVAMLPFIQNAFHRELYGENSDISSSMKNLYKQLLVKDYDYRAEEEWRILSPTNKIDFPIISAIYAGYKITDENLQRLKRICDKKKIPFYKQIINQLKGVIEFELVI